MDAREALFCGTERGLREKARVGKGLLDDAFAEGSDSLGDRADALLVFRSEEKRAKEWAMDAVAKN